MLVALVLAMGVSGCGMDETVTELESVKKSEAVIELEDESEADTKVENETVQEIDTQIQDSIESESDTMPETEVFEPESEQVLQQEPVQELQQETEQEPVQAPEQESESEPVQVPEQKPEIIYTYTDLDKTMYAKASVNVRTLPAKKGTRIGTLTQVAEVQVTGQCNETGWYRIIYNNQTAYVSNNYLVDEKPYIPEVEYEEEEEKSIFDEPYTSILYTEADVLNDGFDEFRMGLHKYTSDGKWQLYQLKDWTFPDGNTYYGYFSTKLDYKWEEWLNEKYNCWVIRGVDESKFYSAVHEMINRFFSTTSIQSVEFLDQYFQYKDVNPDMVNKGEQKCRAYEFVGLSFRIDESEYTTEQQVCTYEEIRALYHYMVVGMVSEGFTVEEDFWKELEYKNITYEEFLEFEKVAEKYNYDDYMKAYYAPGGKNHHDTRTDE